MPKIKGTLENPGLPIAIAITSETVFVGSIDDSPEGTKQYSFALMEKFIADTADIASVIKKMEPFIALANDTQVISISKEDDGRLAKVIMPNLTKIVDFVDIRNCAVFNEIDLPLLVDVGLAPANNGFYINQNQLLTSVNLPKLDELGATFGISNSPLLTELNISLLRKAAGGVQIMYTAITVINLPVLTDYGSQFTLEYNPELLTISLNALVTSKSLNISNNAKLTTINMTSLTGPNTDNADSYYINNNPLLTNINWPSLTKLPSGIYISNNDSLQTFNNPNAVGPTNSNGTLNFVGNAVITSINLPFFGCYQAIIYDNPLLTHIRIGPFSILNIQSAYFTNNALDQASIDHLLSRAENTAFSNMQINLGGGTNATPSSAGLASKSALQARGWTVTTN